MSYGVLKPSENSTEETIKLLQRLSTYLFSLPGQKIDALVSELAESKTSFSVSRVSDKLDVPIEQAYSLHYFLLHTVHQYSKHDVSIETMEKEFESAGFDVAKVKTFLNQIQGLDDYSKKCAEVIYWAPEVVEDKFHIRGLGLTISYQPLEGENLPPNLIPVLKFTMSLEMKDKTQDVDMYLPISHAGRLAKSIQALQRQAEREIRDFKSHLAKDVIVPDGG